MKRIARMTLCTAAIAAMAMAADFSGMLLDHTCYDRDKKAQTCAATASTTMFAIDVAGKVYALDDSGNTKAAAAMKSRADRSKPNSGAASTQTGVMAKVTGTASGDKIAVESIDIQ
jgi:hypothetical protein